MTESITLTQFIIEQQRQNPSVFDDFTLLLSDIVKICKQIAHLVNRGGLIGVLCSCCAKNTD